MVSVLLLGLFLMSVSRTEPVVRHMESTFADWVSTNTSRPAPSPQVVLVEINDSSLDQDHPWPWSPLEYALFMRGALQFKPDVLAIEPALNWDNPQPARGGALLKQQQYLKILHDYVLQAPKIVLGSQLGFPDDPEVVPPLQQVPLLRNIKGDAGYLPEFTAIADQAGEDLRLTAAVGFTNVPSQGEITRKAPLLFRYRGQVVPSLALQAIILWLKLTPDEVVVEPGVKITLGKLAVPIDSKGMMNVDFTTPLTRFGCDDLLLAVDQQKGTQTAIPTAALKGSIALLARTDKESRTLRFPTMAKASAGELCARAIATMQAKGFGHRVTYLFDFAVIAVMMACSCFYHRFGKGTMLLASFAGMLVYLVLSMSVYEIALAWLPIVLPMGLLLLVNFFSLFSAREVIAGAVLPDAAASEK